MSTKKIWTVTHSCGHMVDCDLSTRRAAGRGNDADRGGVEEQPADLINIALEKRPDGLPGCAGTVPGTSEERPWRQWHAKALRYPADVEWSKFVGRRLEITDGWMNTGFRPEKFSGTVVPNAPALPRAA